LCFCSTSNTDSRKIAEANTKPKIYKQRFTVKVGNNIIVVDIGNIAYFYSENKSTYLVTNDRKQYLMDQSLDSIEEQVNPVIFFKISRGCIANLNSIETISKHFNSRLKVTLKPGIIDPILVSRARVPQLLEWLEQ
jgi:DNA-binding LytR/AlgR family response regulator